MWAMMYKNVKVNIAIIVGVLVLGGVAFGLSRSQLSVEDQAYTKGKAGRREITVGHPKVKRARELKTQGLKPADIGKIIGTSRATVYRYLSMDAE